MEGKGGTIFQYNGNFGGKKISSTKVKQTKSKTKWNKSKTK
jgi:hypothetical protein